MLRGICALLTVVALLFATCGCELEEDHKDNSSARSSSVNR